MAEHRFRPGNIVKCIKTDHTGRLKKNHKYTVESVHTGTGEAEEHMVKLEEEHGWWFRTYFFTKSRR